MTQWQEFPLRPQGRPWPGLNTRGGALDNGTGQLEDGSFGQIINEADILEKRKGFVRGLNERFTGVVCGLFKYTDDCGREFLLVADQEAISIRQPFVIPVFVNSDAYPFDPFTTDEINTANWRNTSRYAQREDKLVEVFGAAELDSAVLDRDDWMRWFKEATNLSYQVRIEYEFQDSDTEQHQGIVIKGNGDLTAGAYLQAELVFNELGTYKVTLFFRDASGDLKQLGTADVSGINRTGFLTLKYAKDLSLTPGQQFAATIEVLPLLGAPVSVLGLLNAIQDADLGQISAVGVGHRLGAETLTNGIKVVDGGPI